MNSRLTTSRSPPARRVRKYRSSPRLATAISWSISAGVRYSRVCSSALGRLAGTVRFSYLARPPSSAVSSAFTPVFTDVCGETGQYHSQQCPTPMPHNCEFTTERNSGWWTTMKAQESAWIMTSAAKTRYITLRWALPRSPPCSRSTAAPCRLQWPAWPGPSGPARRSTRSQDRPVDWVERIPFAETRNYVQRVMENRQVYRGRFGASDISLRCGER